MDWFTFKDSILEFNWTNLAELVRTSILNFLILKILNRTYFKFDFMSVYLLLNYQLY